MISVVRRNSSILLALAASATIAGFGGRANAVPPLLIGDYNADGIVDALDAGVWAAHLGEFGSLIADGDQDGVVGPVDYVLIAVNLGTTADLPTPDDPTPAALIYNAATGHVRLDQSNAEGGAITAFILNSGTGSLHPGVANFPYPTPAMGNGLSVPTEFGAGSQIGQIDVTAARLPAVQFDLGAILPAGLTPAGLQTALAGSFYMPAPGHGPSSFSLFSVPEPSGLCLTALLSALAAAQKHRRG